MTWQSPKDRWSRLARINWFTLPILAATLAIAPADPPAAARPLDPSLRVVVADLDFSRPRDVEIFRRRVDMAARALCRQESQLDFYETNACNRGIAGQSVRKLNDGQRRELQAASRKLRTW